MYGIFNRDYNASVTNDVALKHKLASMKMAQTLVSDSDSRTQLSNRDFIQN